MQFPNLTTVNHEEECRRFTAILNRRGQGGVETVNLEELDVLQTDLEILLASVGRRLKLLESEIQTLQNWQDKKDVKLPVNTPTTTSKGKVLPEPAPSVKRGKAVSSTSDERPIKKFKDSSVKVPSLPPPSVASPAARTKSKLPQGKGQDSESVHSPAELPRVVKNECVDRFWQAMEGYCRPITDDDIKFLEEQIRKTDEEESVFFKVSLLGRHYREVWAEEDLLEEVAEGNKVNDKRHSSYSNHTNSSTPNGSNGTAEPSALLKKAELRYPLHAGADLFNVEESPFGPLTQRLVSAFLEENLLTPIDDLVTDLGENAEEAPAISPRILAKQLNIGNPAALERRIQRELEEQGILEVASEEEEEVEDDPNDEILTALKQAQSSLKPLLQWKGRHLKDLLIKAKEQQSRQQLWKQFEECDAKLHDEYRKLNLARQKKKPNLKRERECVKKVLKEWWSIYQSLDESYDG